MKNPEKLCLKWNDFNENLNSAFGELRNDNEFSDVTLACEDGTQVKAHKVILASLSPFFMDILKRHKHPHPLIYMRGIKAETLIAAVDFFYFGEAKFCEENLDDFLLFVEELRLKGLTGSAESNQPKYQNDEPPGNNTVPRKQHKEPIREMPAPMDIQPPRFEKEPPSKMPVALLSDDVRQLNEQIKTMMEFSGNGSRSRRICKVCGKEDQMANIMTHIEANHITSNISFSCDICGKISRSRNGLRWHKERNHKNYNVTGPETA